jgi:hypothetical protein
MTGEQVKAAELLDRLFAHLDGAGQTIYSSDSCPTLVSQYFDEAYEALKWFVEYYSPKGMWASDDVYEAACLAADAFAENGDVIDDR